MERAWEHTNFWLLLKCARTATFTLLVAGLSSSFIKLTRFTKLPECLPESKEYSTGFNLGF